MISTKQAKLKHDSSKVVAIGSFQIIRHQTQHFCNHGALVGGSQYFDIHTKYLHIIWKQTCNGDVVPHHTSSWWIHNVPTTEHCCSSSEGIDDHHHDYHASKSDDHHDHHNDNYHDNQKANLGPGFCSCLVHSQHAGSAGQVAWYHFIH